MREQRLIDVSKMYTKLLALRLKNGLKGGWINMDLKCRKCDGGNFATRPNSKNPDATDLYCTDCDAWQKFANKDEVRLYSKAEKTADEILQKLGYERVVRSKAICVYSSGIHQIILRNNPAEKFVEKVLIHPDRPSCNLLTEELRAVCKLLDEMGVE